MKQWQQRWHKEADQRRQHEAESDGQIGEVAPRLVVRYDSGRQDDDGSLQKRLSRNASMKTRTPVCKLTTRTIAATRLNSLLMPKPSVPCFVSRHAMKTSESAGTSDP